MGKSKSSCCSGSKASAGEADREYIFQVTTKMHCGKCTNTVETALRAVSGVKSAKADLKSQTVRVVVNATAADMTDSLIEAIKDVGFEAHVGTGDCGSAGEKCSAGGSCSCEGGCKCGDNC